jgi:predicted DNA-binding ribbon-helix-helix protein
MPMARTAEHDKSGHRLSITLSDEQYAELTQIAAANRVSIAWVVREAVERLLVDDQPLFKIRKHAS